MTFCVTKWFQRRYGVFKRKNINKYKTLQRRHVCISLHHGSYVGGPYTQWKKAPTSHTFMVHNMEKTTSYVYTVLGTIY